jgi:hypothetical protein
MRLLATSFLLLYILLTQACCELKETQYSSAHRLAPCNCRVEQSPCPGQTHCPNGFLASCRCKSGQCVGECYSSITKKKELTVVILNRITGKTLTKNQVFSNQSDYISIIKSLLSNGQEGIYNITYGSETITFVFSEKALSLLNEVIKEVDLQTHRKFNQ